MQQAASSLSNMSLMKTMYLVIMIMELVNLTLYDRITLRYSFAGAFTLASSCLLSSILAVSSVPVEMFVADTSLFIQNCDVIDGRRQRSTEDLTCDDNSKRSVVWFQALGRT